MSRGERKAMISRDHPGLSLSRQCRVLAISRSTFYYAPKGESPENLALMRRIDDAVHEVSVLRLASDGPSVAARGDRGGPSPGTAPDAPHGAGGDLSGAENQRPPFRTTGLSLPAQRNGDRPPQPGLVRRHHLQCASTRIVRGAYVRNTLRERRKSECLVPCCKGT